MHRGFIIYDDLWHGTLLLKESASKLTFYAFYRRCNLLSCYLLLPGGRYSTVIRGLIAIFRKCIISLYFGIEGGIPHFGQRVIQEQFSKQEDTFSIALQFSKTLPGTVVTWDCRKVPLKKVAFTHFANKRSGIRTYVQQLKSGSKLLRIYAIIKQPAGIDKILGIAEKVELNFTAEEHPLNVLAGIEFRAV